MPILTFGSEATELKSSTVSVWNAMTCLPDRWSRGRQRASREPGHTGPLQQVEAGLPMFRRALRHARNRRRGLAAGVALALVAAPLFLLPSPGP